MPSGTFFRDSSGIRFPHKVNCAMSESMFNELKEIGLATDETLSTCIREALGLWTSVPKRLYPEVASIC